MRYFATKPKEIRETLYLLLPVHYENINDISEKPDEVVHRARYGRVPSTRATVPMKLGTPLF